MKSVLAIFRTVGKQESARNLDAL